MTSIRPHLPPQAAPQSPTLDAGRAAAQRAFFAAALGQGQAPAANPEPVAPQRASPPSRTPDPAAEPPAKVLRPGSLLDIRV